MRIAITADAHVGVPGKLKDIMWALRQIRSYCHEHDIKYIFMLGDLLHDREAVRLDDLTALVDFLIETDEKYGIEIIAFPGNHDMYLKNSWDINSLKPLARYLTCYHDIANFNLGGIRFWVVPFMHYESDYMKAIEDINSQHEEGDILLTHIGVKSATLNMCFLLKSWSVVDFTDSPFDLIYTGHFHTYQKVGDNVWYPGSPIPFKFDEGDSDHGFMVLDTESRKHKFINLWECAKEDYKPPKFMTIDDSSLSDISNNEIAGNMIRVALSSEYTHNQLSEIKEDLQKKGAKEVRWMHLNTEQAKQAIEAVQLESESRSLFERFIDSDNDGTKGLNKNFLLKLNSEIVAEGDARYIGEEE